MNKIDNKTNNLLMAAKNVMWKLNHNYAEAHYNGPARITRDDITIKLLQKAIDDMGGGDKCVDG